MNTAKKFKNFSLEDFTWKFNGSPRTFLAEQEVYMMEEEADHFAKHLIDRELNREGILTNSVVDRNRMLLLCFPGDEVVSADEALQINESEKVAAKKKVVKGKKVEEAVSDDFDE